MASYYNSVGKRYELQERPLEPKFLDEPETEEVEITNESMFDFIRRYPEKLIQFMRECSGEQFMSEFFESFEDVYGLEVEKFIREEST